MSADAWWVCKFCNPEEIDNKKYYHPKYGTIETVRVDYDHWMDEKGAFCFSGKAHCEKCDRIWKIDVAVPSNKDK